MSRSRTSRPGRRAASVVAVADLAATVTSTAVAAGFPATSTVATAATRATPHPPVPHPPVPPSPPPSHHRCHRCSRRHPRAEPSPATPIVVTAPTGTDCSVGAVRAVERASVRGVPVRTCVHLSVCPRAGPCVRCSVSLRPPPVAPRAAPRVPSRRKRCKRACGIAAVDLWAVSHIPGGRAPPRDPSDAIIV